MVRLSLKARSGIAAASILFLVLSGIAPLLLEPGISAASHSQCSDGIDNDNDARTDYPQDSNCDSIDDRFEGEGTSAVFVSITDRKDEIQQGDTLIYVISLLQQRQDYRNVTVDLHLPPEVDLLGVSDGGQISEERVRWDNVTLARNATKQITVQARVRTTARVGTLVLARVSTEGTLSTDTTRITGPQIYPAKPAFEVSVTDGQKFTSTQAYLTYVLRAENVSGRERTVRVQALIPASVTVEESPAGADFEGHKISWGMITFQPDERREFTFRVRVPERVTDYLPLLTRVVVDGVSASDSTVVRTGYPSGGLTLSLSADHNAIARGDLLTYTILVRNETDHVATSAAVNASLPLYGEFVSITEGGFWDGRTVHWRNLQIAPRSTRTLTYVVRIRPDAPIGNRLYVTAEADGWKDGMHNVVSDRSDNLAKETDRGSGARRITQRGVLRKVADSTEVLPGGHVRYTVYVRNTLAHSISDAVVTDRFNPSFLTVIDRGGATISSAGELQWEVPVLQPGQEWSQSYVLGVLPEVAHGTVISNIARITGTDIADAAVNERVSVSQIGIVSELPAAGAPLDALASLLMLPMALGPALLQRRKMRAC